MKKRPIGVILSAIVLGLIAGFQLLVAAFFLVVGIAFPTISTQAQTGPIPNAGFVTGLMIGMSIFVAILAAWGTATVVGLIRLKNWARWSILVIAGCMLAFSLIAILGIAATSYALPSAMQQRSGGQPVPDGLFHAILLLYALVYVVLGVLAGWWLVYFSLRSTRAYFLPAFASTPVLYAPPTDFALPTPAPPAGPQRRVVPVPVVIVAALFLLTALCCLPSLFLPFPLFFAGFIVAKPASIVIYACFILVFALLGVGLLRLDNRARLATFGLIGLGAANMLVFLTPWCQHRFQAYYDQMLASMGVPVGLAIPVTSPPLLAISFLFGIGVYGFVFWTLREYRTAFVLDRIQDGADA